MQVAGQFRVAHQGLEILRRGRIFQGQRNPADQIAGAADPHFASCKPQHGYGGPVETGAAWKLENGSSESGSKSNPGMPLFF